MEQSMFKHKQSVSSISKIATVALLMGTVGIGAAVLTSFSHSPAWAEGETEGGKGAQGKGDQGKGKGETGSQQGQGNQGQGSGQGGPSTDSDGQGPQAGGPSSSGGGKPVWAQEGIPEVELGRLSVARSPAKVLDRSLAEALANVTPELVNFYNLSLQEAISKLSLDWNNVAIYDSPLQSLALLRDILADGKISVPGVTNDNETLMALTLGIASDKTVPISVNTVIAVTTILGYPMSLEQAAALAADAEAIRIAVLAGHG
jgi:hypothetical protein